MVVRAYAGPMAQEVGRPLPDCSRCRRPDAANERRDWGCDAEVERVVFTTGCSRCFGADPECPTCEGSGDVEHHRCPNAVVKAAPESVRRAAGRAMRAYAQFDQRSVMPAAGGFEDQTPQFAQVVDLIDHERGRWRKEVDRKREKDRERMKRKASQPRTR